MKAGSYYIVAGEPSGDRHAAGLARELAARDSGAKILGVGGRHLRAAGQEQLFDLAEHAVVGLVDVLRNYGKFRRMFHRVLADIKERNPAVVILVDFPGFNLRLAKVIRRRHPHIRLVYYIAPQVWAWKSGRAREMERCLDLLLVIFPFEKKWFADRTPGLPVEWVGHPTLEEWSQDSMEAYEKRGALLVLLPGSRLREIEAHLPVFLEAARALHPVMPEIRFLLLAPDAVRAQRLREMMRAYDGLPEIHVEDGYHMTHLSHARMAWVASGTATLECAMAGVPMAVIYKTQPLTWWVGRRLVKLKWLSMVNIVAGEKVVPEFLQSEAKPEAFMEVTRRMWQADEGMLRLHRDLVELTHLLKGKGASVGAAEEILKLMSNGSRRGSGSL
ncbi:MAG: lipid-A-disaccharide synthase [Candidatus Methylacidiphilales bacterium]